MLRDYFWLFWLKGPYRMLMIELAPTCKANTLPSLLPLQPNHSCSGKPLAFMCFSGPFLTGRGAPSPHLHLTWILPHQVLFQFPVTYQQTAFYFPFSLPFPNQITTYGLRDSIRVKACVLHVVIISPGMIPEYRTRVKHK